MTLEVEQAPEQVQRVLKDIMPQGADYHKFYMTYKMLTRAPCSVSEICASKGYDQRTVNQYIRVLRECNLAEKVKNVKGYYQLIGHDYSANIDLAGAIGTVPRIYFRKIPVIQRWATLALGNPEQNKYLNKFESICYGEVVPEFKINPQHWDGISDAERFYLGYKEMTAGKELPVLERKTIRAFLSNCLKLRFDKRDPDAKSIGLAGKKELSGKYKFVKLTQDEFVQAKDWVAKEGSAMAQVYGITPACLHAHFAFATEGFPRPSRVLTIETARVERYPNKPGDLASGEHLEWVQGETKQGKYYPKMMSDKQLVDWAWSWVLKRRQLNYRYLFVDDNEYQMAMYDDTKLAEERYPFKAIYKEMFKSLGKKDSYFYTNTLYSLRHIGVHLWLERLGYAGLVIIQTMGWESLATLQEHYAGMTGRDIRDYFYRQGVFMQNQ